MKPYTIVTLIFALWICGMTLYSCGPSIAPKASKPSPTQTNIAAAANPSNVPAAIQAVISPVALAPTPGGKFNLSIILTWMDANWLKDLPQQQLTITATGSLQGIGVITIPAPFEGSNGSWQDTCILSLESPIDLKTGTRFTLVGRNIDSLIVAQGSGSVVIPALGNGMPQLD